MAYVMEIKDGKTATVFEFRDVLEIVEEYAGEEVRRYLEEYLEENIQEAADFEAQAADYEKELEQQGDHHRSILYNVREKVEALEILLRDKRLNRARLQGAIKILYQMVNREL